MRARRAVFSSPWTWAVVALTAALLLKFFLPLAVFGVPLGYDAGIYRYLFETHATAFPPFWIAPMDHWAREHPLGLFFFGTVLMRAGVPSDWLIGWIWNLMPVVLAVKLAWVTRLKRGVDAGVLTLLMALLSVAFFDGFVAMYWKTYASLLCCVLALHFLDRRSWWAAVAAMFAVAIHHQTGLLLGLVLASWAASEIVSAARDKKSLRLAHASRALFPVLCGTAVLIAGILWYLPVWREAIAGTLPLLLRVGNAPAGSFPPLTFFMEVSGILLALGIVGFVATLRKEGLTPWHWAALWPAVFVALRLLFHQRFYLHLDFFLLPFAASGLLFLWHKTARNALGRTLVVAVMIIQACLSLWLAVPGIDPCIAPWVCRSFQIPPVRPLIEKGELDQLAAMAFDIPANAQVLALDPLAATFVRGWLPAQRVAGPGIFTEPFGGYAEWERFILGTSEQRTALLRTVKGPIYLYISPFFLRHYDDSTSVPRDPCLVATRWPALRKWNC